MNTIEVREKCLTFSGCTADALHLVNNLRDAYRHNDMPKMLNDFVFGIEVALQDAYVLDENFNEIRTAESK